MRRPTHTTRGGEHRPRLASELKPIDEALRESEERFHAIAQLSGDWYWEQDANYRFTWAFVRGGSGAEVSSLIGKTRWETGEQPLKGTWEEHRRLLDSRQPFHDFELRFVDKNVA
jgi:PAS domain-containing protein